MSELTALSNIGKELARQLERVGICTPEKLATIGAKEAWLRIAAIDPSACINRLYALEGAIRGIRWHSLPPEVKVDLRAFSTSARKLDDQQSLFRLLPDLH